MLSAFDLEHTVRANQIEAACQAEKARQLAELEIVKSKSQSLRGATARVFISVGLKLDPSLALEIAS